MLNLRTGFFEANEKGMEYPPEFSNLFKGATSKEQHIEINLIENEKDIEK